MIDFYKVRLVIVLVLSLLFFTTKAQITKLEFGSGYKKEKPCRVDFINNSDNSALAIISQYENKCKVHIVGKDFKKVASFDLPVKEKSFYQGGVFINDTLRFYYFTSTYTETTLTTCNFLLSQSKLEVKNSEVALFDENILHLIVKDERLIVFTLKNSQQAFGAYTYVNGERRIIHTYNFTGKVPRKAKALEDLGIMGKARPALVTKRFEPEFGSIINQKIKTFVNQDSIHMILNSNTGETVTYNLSLQNNGCSYRTIQHAKPEYNETGKKVLSEDNSYLCGKKLFYLIAYPDSMLLMVYDYHSGIKLKTFTSYKNDTISFKNTFLLKNGEVARQGLLDLTVNKPAEQFKLLQSGQLILYAEETAEAVEVMLGSFKKYYTGGTMGSPGIPGSRISTPYGSANIGGSPGGIGGRPSVEITEHLEIISVLNKEDLSHNEEIKNPVSSLRQRKIKFAGTQFRKPLELMYVKCGGKEYVLYYNNGDRLYEVFNFNAKFKE